MQSREESQQGSGGYDPLLPDIDIIAELNALDQQQQLQHTQEQQQQQQCREQQLYQPFPDSSDGSFSVSLSPLSTCSSYLSPPGSAGHHQHQHQHHHQQMPLTLEEDPDILLLAAASPLPPSPPLSQQAQLLQMKQEAAHYPEVEEEMSEQPPPADAAASADVASKPQRHQHRDDKICGVCGDKALGFNFDAVSCESCKAFFRRNAAKGVEAFKCPYTYNCQIDLSNRRFCKRCRLQKCFDIGMKKEYILSEQEKMEKRKKIDQNKMVRTLESLQLLPKDLSPTELADRELLTEADLADVRFLLQCYAESEVVKVPEREGQHAVSVDDLINFAELSVVRVVDMCKKLPEFQRLSQPDKLCLLKGGAMELILLRGVISFDPDQARFLDTGDVDSATEDSMSGSDFLKAAGSNGYAFLQLARCLRSGLQCDRATLILLLAVCLFSADRPGLTPEGCDLAEESQVRYSLLLERVLRTRLPSKDARRIYPQLLTQLAELRGLEKDFTDLAGLSDPRLVRPLMAEFLDIQDAKTGKLQLQKKELRD